MTGAGAGTISLTGTGGANSAWGSTIRELADPTLDTDAVLPAGFIAGAL